MTKVTMRSKKTAAAEFSARLLREVNAALYNVAQGRQTPEATVDRADAGERGEVALESP
jgi:hypothetical protein